MWYILIQSFSGAGVVVGAAGTAHRRILAAGWYLTLSAKTAKGKYERNPFTCSEQVTVTMYSLWGEHLLLPLPFPIFDLVHVQLIMLVSVQMKSCLPGNWITNEEKSCYPNSLLPSNHWSRSIISLHVHHAYFNKAQNLWLLFYSNPQGGGSEMTFRTISIWQIFIFIFISTLQV